MTDKPLDRLLELKAEIVKLGHNGSCILGIQEEYQSLKSQLESDLDEHKKIKKVFIECDLITESGNIFIPDLKGLKEGHMIIVDREEYEELDSKLAFCDKQLEAWLISEPQMNTFTKVMEYILKLQRAEMETEAKRLEIESQHTNLVKAIQDALQKCECEEDVLELPRILQNLLESCHKSS